MPVSSVSLKHTAVVLIGHHESDREGVQKLGEALAPLLPTTHFSIGYYKRSDPGAIAETIENVIRQGAKRVLVLPALPARQDKDLESAINHAMDGVRLKFASIPVEYAWPIDLNDVAGFLAAHIRKAAANPPQDTRSLVAQFVGNQPVGGRPHG